MKCLRVKARKIYEVLVKKECAEKVLKSGKVSCGDCVCKFVDCDDCSLRDCSNASIYRVISIEETNDKKFDVTDLINMYYKPMPNFNVKVGDKFKSDEGIITITQHVSKYGHITYWTEWDNGHVGHCSLEAINLYLLDNFNNIEKLGGEHHE